jgi:hypothetical protein
MSKFFLLFCCGGTYFSSMSRNELSSSKKDWPMCQKEPNVHVTNILFMLRTFFERFIAPSLTRTEMWGFWLIIEDNSNCSRDARATCVSENFWADDYTASTNIIVSVYVPEL